MVLAVSAQAAAPRPEPSCSTDRAEPAEVQSVDNRLDLTLANGMVLNLASVDPPFPTPDDPLLDEKAKKRLSAWLAGRKVLFRALNDRKDRWGRMPALVFAEAGRPGAPLLSVNAAVLDAGFGRFAPGATVRPCRSAFLAAEAAARKAKLGVWADPYYAVIAASDRDTLYARTGTSVVVEGVVAGVVGGRFRTSILLGPQRGRDLAVSMTPRNLETFREAGLDPDALRGKTLRVHGLLDTRFGPQIEVSSPDEIEIVADTVSVSAGPRTRSKAR